ncbi:unnamed protein product, partial [Didymodactylos carnosus]
MTRFMVNQLFVGRWLTFWSGWSKSIDTRDCNRELALCYYQLLKIEFMLNDQPHKHLCLFNLMLCLLNTSFSAGKKLEITIRIEIYLFSILIIKYLFEKLSLPLIHIGMKRIQYWVYLSKNDDYTWLLDSDNVLEFITITNNENKYSFSSSIERGKYKYLNNQMIRWIHDKYNDYVLHENVMKLLLKDGTGQTMTIFDKKEFKNITQLQWWQHIIELIKCVRGEYDINELVSTDHIRYNRSIQYTIKNKITIYDFVSSKNIIDEKFISIGECLHDILLMLNDTEQPNITYLFQKLARISKMVTDDIYNDNELNL